MTRLRCVKGGIESGKDAVKHIKNGVEDVEKLLACLKDDEPHADLSIAESEPSPEPTHLR